MVKKIILAILFSVCVSGIFCQSDEIQEKIDIVSEFYESGEYWNVITEGEALVKALKKQKTKDMQTIADIEYKIGESCQVCGIYSEALNHLTKALEIYIAIEGETSLSAIDVHESLGNVYKSLDNDDKAWEQYQKALSIIEAWSTSDGGIVDRFLMANMADILRRRGDFETALDYYNQALATLKESFGEDYHSEALIYNAIGNVYRDMGEFGTALSYYQKALLVSQSINDGNNLSTAIFYNSFAEILWKIGYYEEATPYFINSLLPLMGSEWYYNEETLRILFSCARFLSELRNGGLLEKYANNEGVLKALSQFNSKDVIEKFRIIDPEFNGMQQPTDWSLFECNLLLMLIQGLFNIDEHSLIASTYNLMGLIYASRDDYTKALNYYKKSLAMYKKLFEENNPQIGYVYYNIAELNYDRGDAKNAIKNWKKAYDCWKTENNYSSVLQCMKTILSHENISDKKFIRETLEFALSISEKLCLNSGFSKDNSMKEVLPIYYYAVQFMAKENEANKALEYSESMRSRAFLAQLGTETALQVEGISESDREKIHNLNKQIEIANKRISEQQQKPLSERNSQIFIDNTKELEKLEKELKSLDEKIAKQVPKYAELRNPTIITASEAQKWCGDNRAVLEYVLWNPNYGNVGNEKENQNSYCIVLTKNKIQIVTLDKSYDYASEVNKLRNRIMNLENEKEFEQYRNNLYSQLIAPALSHLDSSIGEIVIVPDGNLSFLPFDVLRKSANDTDLGEKYAILMSPSVSISKILDDSKKKNVTKVMAFGGAWYDKNLSASEHREFLSSQNKKIDQKITVENTARRFKVKTNEAQMKYLVSEILKKGPGYYFDEKKLEWGDLPYTMSELSNLQNDVFPKGQIDVFSQENATEKNVKKFSKDGTLSQYSILHFACHGYFDTEIAELSSVLFSEVSGQFSNVSDDDGYLTVPEVTALNLDADMVCLSACETGLGEIRAGEGMVGLSRAFMVAGGRNVGVSLWSVDDKATAAFMTKMYENHEAGLSYSDAYQAVKSEFRRSKDWSHPYFWAAFSLYGGGERISPKKHNNSSLVNSVAEFNYSLGETAFNEKEYETAIVYLEKTIETAEHAGAQNLLGVCYYNGLGVSQDYAEAKKWYEKAANQGNLYAQYNLGVCYYNGLGVSQDYAEAKKWFEKAANQGNPDAQYDLGYMYENGGGMQKNIETALDWYKKAASQGDEEAKEAVERLSAKTPKDYLELGYKAYNEEKYNKAVFYYQIAANKENAQAQNLLGGCYYRGLGVSQDYAEAKKWFEKAANQGYPSAQYNLGTMYETGKVVTKNLSTALDWYKKAASQGDEEAKKAVERLTPKVSSKWLFQLYGIELGKTTVAELRAKGEKAKEYDYYKINGQNFWYESGIFCHMYITHDDWIPEWTAIGYDVNLSYQEWIQFLKSQGYEIFVTEKPSTEYFNGKNSLKAEIVAKRNYPVGHTLQLDFRFSGKTGISERGTLFDFGVDIRYLSLYTRDKYPDDGSASTSSATNSSSSSNWLFPLYGLELGKTSEADLKKIGKKKSERSDWYYINLGGGEQACSLSASKKLHGFYIKYWNGKYIKSWPHAWEELGFIPSLSYKEWLSFLKSQGYSVKITKSPSIDKYDYFEAEIEATRSYPIEHRIEIVFDLKENAKTKTKDTMYSFYVWEE